MPRIAFDALPDSSRLWIFGAGDVLSDRAVAQVLDSAASFIESWAAHGTPLTGGCTLIEGRFLLVAVDQASVPPSGCSIDAMVRVLKGLEGEIGQPGYGIYQVVFSAARGVIYRVLAAARRSPFEADKLRYQAVVIE